MSAGLVLREIARGGEGSAAAARSVVIATLDAGLRERLRQNLTALRWTVRLANGGAEALAQIEEGRAEALLMDSWLPDLEAGEFTSALRVQYPALDILRVDGRTDQGGAKSPRRNELLHALRESADDGDAPARGLFDEGAPVVGAAETNGLRASQATERSHAGAGGEVQATALLPEMVGGSAPMVELARLIRLVAPRSATVLIEGETGSGKELVARAVHLLSLRAAKPFAVLNCAAIPEALLEAELFGHTRGAFTGAVSARTGRIEAANGGTLFLDEIGEMPLALQAKMLRFLECGEIQRVGDNESLRVDVRIVAATHQALARKAEERSFRLDLYHRLAVFPVWVPSLRRRMEDLGALTEFFLNQMGREMPRKTLSPEATAALRDYGWPGNVRELMHVLERGAILAGDRPVIEVDDIQIRRDQGE